MVPSLVVDHNVGLGWVCLRCMNKLTLCLAVILKDIHLIDSRNMYALGLWTDVHPTFRA